MSLTKYLLIFATSVSLVLTAEPLTLKQIMADPDWIARSPESPQWSLQDDSIVFQQKMEGHSSRQYFKANLANNNIEQISDKDLALLESVNGSFNSDRSAYLYINNGSLLLKEVATNKVQPLYVTSNKISNSQFLNDGRIAFQEGNRLLVIDSANYSLSELAHFKTEKLPEKWSEPKDFLGAQQRRLFDYIREQQDEKQHRESLNEQRAEASFYALNQPIYLGEKLKIETLSLAPSGKYTLVVLSKESPSGKSDNMPRFVTDDGYVKNDSVRPLVGTEHPESLSFVFVDLLSGEQFPLSLDHLPGIKNDPLEKLKRATAKAKGEEFKPQTENRAVYVHAWFNSGIAWSDDGSRLALRIFSADNKDRWLAEVDLNKKQFITLDRLSNKAWVNDWTFNQFGWMSDNQTFYYLSEESGYSHLYLKSKGKARQLTKGTFEVSDLTPTRDGKWIYFKANKTHPGQYDVYRVNTKTSVIESITELGGQVDYVLSNDESKVAFLHSSLTRPNELFWKSLTGNNTIHQLTQTVTEAFKSINWQAPQIVGVPSSHTDKLIYSKIYLPKGFNSNRAEKYPAVMFVHGAGYLQNAHFGWSGYFREYMFHNLLTEQGYVVIDMDYRASKGYGSDWRTAIYQQMGTPELEDYLDGKQYLVKNFNVDGNSVGIYGGSYGGFMTFMALFKAPGEFAAGASLRPVTDWSSYNHGYTSNILNTPEVDPEAYNRSSPIEFAEGLSDHLLIAHGMVDDNVFFKDSVRLVQRLIELEKTRYFELAVYPIEPHGFREPSSWLDEYTRIYLLFEKHLKRK